MPLDMGLWRVDEGVRRVMPSGMPSEQRLEDLIESDPSVLGEPLLIIGRQVPTSHGKYVDLLAVDGDGALHVLELKRHRTPRDVVAQALDYGSWVQTLEYEDVLDIYRAYRPGDALEVAFDDRFGIPLPEELNTGHYLTIVASSLDPESERIVSYLAATYDVPINAVFFRYFTDGDREYVARTWLREQQTESGPTAGKSIRQREPWNGLDWYVSFGDSEVRSWEDARENGFVSAGGGEWYSRTLRGVPEGARIWACIPRVGYVGFGTVAGPAVRFEESHLAGRADLRAPYTHANGEDEWVVPVEWITAVPQEQAVWHKGMFANQNSATRLRNSFTLELLRQAFPQAVADGEADAGAHGS